ncbi:hypothetical protein HPB51_017661 [Rhipicephalus microplus]|uniref:Uncharacterized protein n=1 Tax=Rhipicephalus microplus TaxID=6941 RepID=A0A9J6E225_RHIMP|nr:hypothetical protein HPB51_017661 [Rhipicephalus microplus]
MMLNWWGGLQEDSSSSAPSGGEFGGSRGGPASGDSPLAGLRKFQDSFLSFLKTPQGAPTAEDIGAPAPLQPPPPQPQGRSASGKPWLTQAPTATSAWVTMARTRRRGSPKSSSPVLIAADQKFCAALWKVQAFSTNQEGKHI